MENTPFGKGKPVKEILTVVDKLISCKPSLTKIPLYKKQYKTLMDSLSTENKRINPQLKRKGIILYNCEE